MKLTQMGATDLNWNALIILKIKQSKNKRFYLEKRNINYFSMEVGLQILIWIFAFNYFFYP